MKTLFNWMDKHVDINYCIPMLLITLGTLCFIWIPFISEMFPIQLYIALFPIAFCALWFFMIHTSSAPEPSTTTHILMVAISALPLIYVLTA